MKMDLIWGAGGCRPRLIINTGTVPTAVAPCTVRFCQHQAVLRCGDGSTALKADSHEVASCKRCVGIQNAVRIATLLSAGSYGERRRHCPCFLSG